MFELSLLKKYLIPTRKQLSRSLIALLSVTVISLIVWLLLLFLSITEGIENNWLSKLTTLHSPLKITPTEKYFNSYYYQIDSISEASDFQYKSITEKASSQTTDPYSPDRDREVPSFWPAIDRDSEGNVIDPVKRAFSAIEAIKRTTASLQAEEFETGGALLKLNMARKGTGFRHLTSLCYLLSFPQESSSLASLQLPLKTADLNNLLLAVENVSDEIQFQKELQTLLNHTKIKTVKTDGPLFRIPLDLLSKEGNLQAYGYFSEDTLTHIVLPDTTTDSSFYTPGELFFLENDCFFRCFNDHLLIPIVKELPIYLEKTSTFEATLRPESIIDAKSFSDLIFFVRGSIQEKPLKGNLAWKDLLISDADWKNSFKETPSLPPLWSYEIGNKEKLPEMRQLSPILLPKNFRENGVLVGDEGHFSYPAQTASSVLEQRFSFYVAGFFDPGLMALGNRSAIAPLDLIHLVNNSSAHAILDKHSESGIQLWLPEIKKTKEIKEKLEASFEEMEISDFWTVTPYYEYEFAKELLSQFASDRYLFTLIGVVALIVACSNIISLLILLVNDKKQEIGILQAMGASKKSIALIFGAAGAMIGLLSSLIGITAAYFTLQNIDSIASFLSFLQGREAFQSIFYGNHLPNTLTDNSLILVLIAAPLISLLAGLVPAIKACRMRPSEILRKS